MKWGVINSESGFILPKKSRPGKPFDKPSFELFHQSLIRDAGENGFPFAVSKFDQVRISGDSVHFHLQFKTGPSVIWDSIAISGPDKIPGRLLSASTGIVRGSRYREDKFLGVKDRLSSLAFLELTSDPAVVFTANGAVLMLAVKKKKANRANLLVAIQPKPSGTGYFPVGEANMEFNNLINQGERINFEWKSFGGGSQRTLFQVKAPYLLQSPFGIITGVRIQKQDSTFSSFMPEVGALYSLNANSEMSLTYGLMRSGFGRNNTETIKNISERRLTLSYRLSSTDRTINPTKGWLIKTQLGTGQKQSEKYLSDFDDKTSTSATNQLHVNFSVAKFSRLTPRWVVFTMANVGLISNKEEQLYLSEMYRLGGLNTLRGQDEESIFTPSYEGGTLEIRYLLDRVTNIHVFADGKRIRSPYYNGGKTSLPLGVGTGFSFGTGGMIFTLDYAIGTNSQGQFLLRNNRIHMGFSGSF